MYHSTVWDHSTRNENQLWSYGAIPWVLFDSWGAGEAGNARARAAELKDGGVQILAEWFLGKFWVEAAREKHMMTVHPAESHVFFAPKTFDISEREKLISGCCNKGESCPFGHDGPQDEAQVQVGRSFAVDFVCGSCCRSKPKKNRTFAIQQKQLAQPFWLVEDFCFLSISLKSWCFWFVLPVPTHICLWVIERMKCKTCRTLLV